MTGQPTVPTPVEPIDPDSDLGRTVADGLADVLADARLRQAREVALHEAAR